MFRTATGSVAEINEPNAKHTKMGMFYWMRRVENENLLGGALNYLPFIFQTMKYCKANRHKQL